MPEEEQPQKPQLGKVEQDSLDDAYQRLRVHFPDVLIVVRPTTRGRAGNPPRLSLRWTNDEWASGAVCTAGEMVEEARRA
jgi:hypothetical protein